MLELNLRSWCVAEEGANRMIGRKRGEYVVSHSGWVFMVEMLLQQLQSVAARARLFVFGGVLDALDYISALRTAGGGEIMMLCWVYFG